MKRRELEVALLNAGRVTGENEFFLIGSQAVHAFCTRAPAEVLLSQECDLYPRNKVEAADRLHFQLGRGSNFARRHGFYVDVVTPEIACFPEGWERRLKSLRIGRVTAYCVDVHDLLVSKLAAGRLKDLEFAGALLKRGIARRDFLLRRIRHFPIKQERARIKARLDVVLENLA